LFEGFRVMMKQSFLERGGVEEGVRVLTVASFVNESSAASSASLKTVNGRFFDAILTGSGDDDVVGDVVTTWNEEMWSRQKVKVKNLTGTL
jgi:hypothetical protein